MISLADALDTFLASGGEEDDGLPFSTEARIRFARLAAELRDLRRSLADPLMDVLHRVLATTGLEVELSASPQALAARRRETLANFLDVAARFAAVDGEATLLAFLAFLRTAVQYEKGLDNALPGGENTVKVLTAHKSKGLEWDVVAVPGLVTGQFPSGQSRDAWTAQPKVLPHALRGDRATLPDVHSWDAKGLKAFKEEMKEHQHTEELRLGYVTFTRPRTLLLGSGHWWGPSQKKPRGPSGFLHALYEHCAAGHGEIEVWADEPAEDEENPALDGKSADQAWPLPLDGTALTRRRAAADTVMAHLEALATAGGVPDTYAALPDEAPGPDADGYDAPYDDAYDAPRGDAHEAPYDDAPFPDDEAHSDDADDWDALSTERPPSPRRTAAPVPHVPAARTPEPDGARRLTPEEARTLASWDRDLDALAGELRRARATVRDVLVPASLSATQLLRLADDPDGFAQELARPMPRPRSRRPAGAPASTPGWSPASRNCRCPCSGPTSCPAATGATPRSPTSTTSPHSRRPSSAPRTPAAPRTASRRRSRSPWPAGSSGAASTRCTAPGTRTRSSTGRPPAPTPPTPSSSRSTAWPGRNCTTCRSPTSPPRSCTCAAARPSTPRTSRAGRSWNGSCWTRVPEGCPDPVDQQLGAGGREQPPLRREPAGGGGGVEDGCDDPEGMVSGSTVASGEPGAGVDEAGAAGASALSAMVRFTEEPLMSGTPNTASSRPTTAVIAEAHAAVSPVRRPGGVPRTRSAQFPLPLVLVHPALPRKAGQEAIQLEERPVPTGIWPQRGGEGPVPLAGGPRRARH